MGLIKLVFCAAMLITVSAEALEDPTRPPSFQVQAAAQPVGRSFSLDSIMIGPDRRMAVIDGIARREGEFFDGTQLLRIFPDKVELKRQGQRQTLNWPQPPAVRSPR